MHYLRSSSNEVHRENRKILNSNKVPKVTSTQERKPQRLNAKRLKPQRRPLKEIAVVSLIIMGLLVIF